MANIKTTKAEWEKCREYYEAGLSLSKIVEKTGISKTQISKRSNLEGWAKGIPSNRVSVVTNSPSTIYVITAQEFSGMYKIGLTNSISARLASMQTGCPYLLFALRIYEVDNPVAVETMLHSFFHKKRILGEWFKLDDQDLAYIDQAMNCVDEVLTEF